MSEQQQKMAAPVRTSAGLLEPGERAIWRNRPDPGRRALHVGPMAIERRTRRLAGKTP